MTDHMTDQDFAIYLARTLEAFDIQPIDLARALGQSRTTVSRWLDRESLPDLPMRKPICDAIEALRRASIRVRTEALDAIEAVRSLQLQIDRHRRAERRSTDAAIRSEAAGHAYKNHHREFARQLEGQRLELEGALEQAKAAEARAVGALHSMLAGPVLTADEREILARHRATIPVKVMTDGDPVAWSDHVGRDQWAWSTVPEESMGLDRIRALANRWDKWREVSHVFTADVPGEMDTLTGDEEADLFGWVRELAHRCAPGDLPARVAAMLGWEHGEEEEIESPATALCRAALRMP